MPTVSHRFGPLLAAADAIALVIAAPFLLFPTPSRLVAALPVAVVWLLHRLTGGRIVPRTPINLALFLLLAMVAVSAAVTPDLRDSLGKIAGVWLGAIVFWTIARHVTTVSRLRLATIGFVLAGCALAVIGLLGTKWFSKFPALAAVIAKLPQAIRGVPGAEEGFHPNAVAGCLILFVPLQVGLLAGHTSGWLADGWMPEGRQAWGRAMQGALLMLTAGTLALTQSRGAWFGLGVAILGVLLIHSRRTRLVAMAVGACTILAATALGPERIFNLAVSQSGPGMAGNVTGRVELWSRAVYGIHDFPLTGMGMNMFRRVIQLVYPTFLTSPGFDVAHAHNHLLQTALDLGIPGLIAYLAIWMVVLTLLVLVYHRAPERWARVMAGGLIAGLIAHFSFSMTDAIPLGAKVGVLFWLTLALGVALHQMALPMRRQTEKPAAAASS